MRWTIAGTLAGAFAVLVLGGTPQSAAASDNCFYKSTVFSEGGTSCQSGTQYKCDDGEWESMEVACTDVVVKPSKHCELGGIAYATGTGSCQNGTQFRCEDGVWASLGKTCPETSFHTTIKVIPSGKTCMFGDATVSHNSTICRQGETFLCTDGQWANIGTVCR